MMNSRLRRRRQRRPRDFPKGSQPIPLEQRAGVVDLLSAKPTHRGASSMNAEIAKSTLPDEVAALESRLQHQLSGRIRDLHLLLRGHALVLRGYSRTYYAKQLAQHALMSVTNLPIVANEIEVI